MIGINLGRGNKPPSRFTIFAARATHCKQRGTQSQEFELKFSKTIIFNTTALAKESMYNRGGRQRCQTK